MSNSKIDKVRIRMYRQGLGDCFLISFLDSGGGKLFNIMIDCGVIIGTASPGLIMQKVVSNINSETGGTVDLLAATHEHWDHLSGFIQAQDEFKKLKAKQIWLAWTEDAENKMAKSLKKKHAAKLNAIKAAFDKMKTVGGRGLTPGQAADRESFVGAFSSFFSFYGMNSSGVALSGKTSDALNFIKKWTGAKLTYRKPGTLVEQKDFPGIRIYIMGPPEDEKALNKMNPSKKNPETYEEFALTSYGEGFASALTGDTGGSEDIYKPFSRRVEISEEEADKYYPDYFKQNNSWKKIDNDWLYMAGNLALQLDNAINNTSLVLAIELIDSGKILLFPADAQIGNWLSWSSYTWKTSDDKKIMVDDIFRKTVFYKVGHHGSHNATMKEQGLEKMTNAELVAMIPVNQEMAKKKKWKMPFKPLLKALEEKTNGRVVILDEDYPAGAKTKDKGIKDYATDLYYDVYIEN